MFAIQTSDEKWYDSVCDNISQCQESINGANYIFLIRLDITLTIGNDANHISFLIA